MNQFARHLTTDDLEAFALGHGYPSVDEAAVEEHLLVCNSCRESLDEVENDIRLIQAALRDLV